jgi:hypothetical protein
MPAFTIKSTACEPGVQYPNPRATLGGLDDRRPLPAACRLQAPQKARQIAANEIFGHVG